MYKSPGPFEPPLKIILSTTKEEFFDPPLKKNFLFPLQIPLIPPFVTETFGDLWKADNPTPIPKCNPCTVIENLRPIFQNTKKVMRLNRC